MQDAAVVAALMLPNLAFFLKKGDFSVRVRFRELVGDS